MRKKIKLEDLKPNWKVPSMQYYWCSFCGLHGDFKFVRQKNIKCENCGYDDLCKLDKKEYEEGLE